MGICEGLMKRQNQQKASAKSSLQHLNCPNCNYRFNLKERCPIMICINQHNCCKKCVDEFGYKKIQNCPFCKVGIDPQLVTRNRVLIDMMEFYNQTVGDEKTIEENKLSKKDETVRRCHKYNYQQVIYLIHMGPKKPVEEIKQIYQEKCGISKVINLSIFTKLSRLSLKDNNITRISDPGLLEHLVYLNMSFNQITKIENLSRLLKLEHLHLRNNRITKIQNIGKMTQLKILDLAKNQISVIQNLGNQVVLSNLSLNGNKIIKIQNLSVLKSLQVLQLGLNNIRVIQGIFSLPKLKSVKLEQNPIDRKVSRGAIRAMKDLLGIQF